MNPVEAVVARLMETPGIIACWILPDRVRKTLRELEEDSNSRSGFPGMEIVNEGIKDVLNRQQVVVISHSSALRHPPGSIIAIFAGDVSVGEEIWSPGQIEKHSKDPNVVLLGGSLVLYRKSLLEAKQPLRLVYRALRFPELEGLDGIQDVASVTIGTSAHFQLAQEAGWDFDPKLGTVLIGFNICDKNRRGSQKIPMSCRKSMGHMYLQ